MDKLPTEGAAAYIDVPASTLRYWRSTRNPDAPASFMIGRRVFYRVADLDAYLQSQYDKTVVGSRGEPTGSTAA